MKMQTILTEMIDKKAYTTYMCLNIQEAETLLDEKVRTEAVAKIEKYVDELCADHEEDPKDYSNIKYVACIRGLAGVLATRIGKVKEYGEYLDTVRMRTVAAALTPLYLNWKDRPRTNEEIETYMRKYFSCLWKNVDSSD